MTALRNVALPAIFAGLTDEEAMECARRRLQEVGLEHRLEHRPGELSGGQQQRVAIARALVNDPVILLADEPTANLDLQTGGEIIDLMKGLSEEKGVTVITATHDHKMLKNSDRVVRMEDGRLTGIDLREDLEIEEGDFSTQ